MTHKDKLASFLKENDINYSVDEFISYTSNIYHGYEAESYDDRHYSIKLSIDYWAKVTTYLKQYFIDKNDLVVLDFGCGTGFATDQIVNSGLNDKVVNIVCYDLSPEMVMQTMKKFQEDKRISYLSDQEGLKNLESIDKKFDIVMCNALIHHILEPALLLNEINSYLKTGGIFIMGHEPNKLFYQSFTLTAISKIYRIHKRIRRILNRIISKPNRNNSEDIVLLTKNELIRKGVITEKFELKYIPKFIDIHVPLTSFPVQPWGELGFSSKYICKHSNNSYQLLKQFSYNHIKDQEAYKWIFWKLVAKVLSFLLPEKGADAIFIFKKTV